MAPENDIERVPFFDPADQWTLFFSIDQADRNAISHGLAETMEPVRFGVMTELLPDGAEGEVSVALTLDRSIGTTEVEALSAADAAMREARIRGGLAPDGFTLLGVRPPQTPAIWNRLLLRAREYARAGDHEAAVVFAQSACEVLGGLKLRALVQARGAGWLGQLVFTNSSSLRDARSQRVFEATTGIQIQTSRWWRDYVKHAQRRNVVVHEGAEITSRDAEESLRAAAAFVDFVTATTPKGDGPAVRPW